MIRLDGNRRQQAVWGILLVVPLGIMACGGSSSGGGGGLPTEPGPSVFFTPDRAATSPSISMRGGGSTPAVLQLEIFATDMPNFQAVDFVLVYPVELLRYEGFERGELIGAGAQVITDAANSAVAFQVLRTAPSAASGTGIILSITFSAIGDGQGRFDFVDPVAEDPFGLDISGIDWIAGTVRVTL